MIDSTPRLRRQQLMRLSELLSADATLAGRWYQDIVRYPINAPVNNGQGLPTLAIYCTRENLMFATTEQHKGPGAFTALLLYPELSVPTEGLSPQNIYESMLDTANDLLGALKRLHRDPQTPGLWHQIIFGGDSKGARGIMPVGSFCAQYDRDPGRMQVALINFMLVSNLRNVQ